MLFYPNAVVFIVAHRFCLSLIRQNVANERENKHSVAEVSRTLLKQESRDVGLTSVFKRFS